MYFVNLVNIRARDRKIAYIKNNIFQGKEKEIGSLDKNPGVFSK